MSAHPATLPAAGSGRPRSILWWYAALLAPFVLCQIVLLASGKTLPAFWAGDEVFHSTLSRWFAERLPYFDPIYPDSATTPLFQLLGAVALRLCQLSLPWLRVLNTLFSAVGVLALSHQLYRRQRHDCATAAALAAVYLVSCYFFGYSFRWLTDNLALTFCILSVGSLLRFADPAEPRRITTFLWGCLWLSLTILTRQNYLFLGLPFVGVLLISGLPWRAVAIGFGGLALAVAPTAGLICAWHGLVPPAFQYRHTSALIHLYPLALPVMLLGFYAPFFVFPNALRPGSLTIGRLAWPGVAAGVGLSVVALFPLVPILGRPDLLTYFAPEARDDIPGYFAGWLYNVAGHLPALHGNSLLFWLLLPAGLAMTAHFALEAASSRERWSERVAVLFLLGLLLSSALNPVSAQKYYEPPVLLFLLWHTRQGCLRGLVRRGLWLALILLSCCYFAVVVATHADTPTSRPAAAHP